MKLKTSRFGEITIKEDSIYTFAEGLLGFAALTRYVILDNPAGGPLQWLQSLEDEKLAFVICQSHLIKPDYDVPIRKQELQAIQLEKLEDALIYTIMFVPKDNPRGMTANLQGPLILNTRTKLAKQHVLINTEYSTKYRVFKDKA